jgi:ABC-type Fe3+ transport system permease subunit
VAWWPRPFAQVRPPYPHAARPTIAVRPAAPPPCGRKGEIRPAFQNLTNLAEKPDFYDKDGQRSCARNLAGFTAVVAAMTLLGAARRGGRHGARDFRNTRKGWLYSAPAVLIFAAFVIVPTFYTFYVSLWKWNVLNPSLSVYKGLGNYRALFTATDPSFGSSLWHSLYFCGAMVIGGTAISLALALLLQRGGRAVNASRLAIYLPNATPLIATSLIWTWIRWPSSPSRSSASVAPTGPTTRVWPRRRRLLRCR